MASEYILSASSWILAESTEGTIICNFLLAIGGFSFIRSGSPCSATAVACLSSYDCLLMNVWETDYLLMELLENGMLVATYKKVKLINLGIAREIVQARLDFVGPSPRPVMVLNDGALQMDKAARKFMASLDGVAGISAAAIVADHFTIFFFASIIIKIERPPIPVNICRSYHAAFAWLVQYL